MSKETNDYDLDDHEMDQKSLEHELNMPDEPCRDDD